jgi:hypothetical protein
MGLGNETDLQDVLKSVERTVWENSPNNHIVLAQKSDSSAVFTIFSAISQQKFRFRDRFGPEARLTVVNIRREQ